MSSIWNWNFEIKLKKVASLIFEFIEKSWNGKKRNDRCEVININFCDVEQWESMEKVWILEIKSLRTIVGNIIKNHETLK